MKIFELLCEKRQPPIIVTQLLKLQERNIPIFFVDKVSGRLQLRQLSYVDPELKFFSPGAPSDIALTDYTSILFWGVGYYSWENENKSMWNVNGSGSFGLPHVKHNEYHIAKLPSVQGRTDFVFGLRTNVQKWQRKHASK